MKRVVKILAWVLLLASLPGPVPALARANVKDHSITLILRAHVVVVGPEIHLGDLCKLEPPNKTLARKLARLKVTRAAPPGESKDVALSKIRLVLRHAKLERYIKKIKGPRVVRVKTGHRDITRMRLEEIIGAHFNRLLRDFAGEWRLEFKRIPDSLAVPATRYDIRVRSASPFRRGYQTVSLSIRQQGKEVARQRISLVLHTYERVAVARRNLRPGETVAEADVELALRETTHLPAEPLRKIRPDRFALRVFVPSGKVLTRNMVQIVPDVERGKQVQVEVEAGGVRIQTRGLAQQDGNMRDWIRVWLSDTRRAVKGQVVGKGKVRIQL